MFRADLHCHSFYSDGKLSPKELVLLAKEKALSGLAITDHDTLDGYTEELFHQAKRLGIELLVGIEISSLYRKRSVHILGYGFDWKDEKFLAFLEKIKKIKKERNRQIIKKLEEAGLLVSYEQFVSFARENFRSCHENCLGLAHLAFFLVERGVTATFKEGINRYLKEGASCFVRGDFFSSGEVIDQIHLANGKATIAHPHILPKEFLKELLSLPFDGMECYYSTFPFAREEFWIKEAEKRGLFITGGSDFHGFDRKDLSLGASWTEEKTFRLLQ